MFAVDTFYKGQSRNPIRVMFYEPYPMGLGGNFLTQRLILERLNRLQFTPIIVAPVEGVALGEFRKMGVECVVLPPQGKLGHFGGAILQAGLLSRLKISIDLLRYNLKIARFISNNKIDVVYTNCVRAQLSVGLATWLSRIPSMLYIKGELANPVIDFISFLSAKRILFMCRSNLLLKYPKLIKKFQSKISVLEGGLEPKELSVALNNDKSNLMQELDVRSQNFNVCVVGQICPTKGQHVVINALSNMVSDIFNIRVYFVGDSVIKEYEPYVNKIKKLVEKLDLSDYTRFLGWRNDSMAVISCMDLLINPSFTEGFGYVPLEGMALGLPVIATNVGVLPEAIIDGENGFLFEPGDDSMLTKRWLELQSNPELCKQIGQNARRTIENNYLIDDKVELLSQIWVEMSDKYNVTKQVIS